MARNASSVRLLLFSGLEGQAIAVTTYATVSTVAAGTVTSEASKPVQNVASLSVVIPVYNAGPNLLPLLERLIPVLELATGTYEVILVNDGSRDASWRTIQALAATRPWLRAINLMRNYGQHNALLCGIRAAKNQVIITMDDDLQHPPEEIFALLHKLDEGFDVVYGAPRQPQHGLWRNAASYMTKLILQSAMDAEIARDVSAFRVFDARLREAFARYQGTYVSVDVLLTWGTTRFAAVPVLHAPRYSGKSNYTLRKLITHSLSMLTGFSTLPLQCASLVGFAFTLLGLGLLAFVLGRYFIQGGGVPGFPFLASMIAIFSGAQLFALGIIGEYLSRMHFRMMERPPYAERERLNEGEQA